MTSNTRGGAPSSTRISGSQSTAVCRDWSNIEVWPTKLERGRVVLRGPARALLASDEVRAAYLGGAARRGG